MNTEVCTRNSLFPGTVRNIKKAWENKGEDKNIDEGGPRRSWFDFRYDYVRSGGNGSALCRRKSEPWCQIRSTHGICQRGFRSYRRGTGN